MSIVTVLSASALDAYINPLTESPGDGAVRAFAGNGVYCRPGLTISVISLLASPGKVCTYTQVVSFGQLPVVLTAAKYSDIAGDCVTAAGTAAIESLAGAGGCCCPESAPAVQPQMPIVATILRTSCRAKFLFRMVVLMGISGFAGVNSDVNTRSNSADRI